MRNGTLGREEETSTGGGCKMELRNARSREEMEREAGGKSLKAQTGARWIYFKTDRCWDHAKKMCIPREASGVSYLIKI